MAELKTVTKTAVARAAGVKANAASFNRERAAVVSTPPAYAAPALNDTAGTDLVLPLGTRVLLPVTVSNAAGTAASVLSVGIRDAITKVAIDPTAILNAAPINAAQTAQFNTGTKLINGQDYLMPQDAEIYLTFGGAAGAANQAIRVEVNFVAP